MREPGIEAKESVVKDFKRIVRRINADSVITFGNQKRPEFLGVKTTMKNRLKPE